MTLPRVSRLCRREERWGKERGERRTWRTEMDKRDTSGGQLCKQGVREGEDERSPKREGIAYEEEFFPDVVRGVAYPARVTHHLGDAASPPRAAAPHKGILRNGQSEVRGGGRRGDRDRPR